MTVRITNSMITNSVMYHLNTSLYNLNRTYGQMSSGKRIDAPSDDPLGASAVLKYTDYVSRIEQYKANCEEASGWLNVTEEALDGVTDCLSTVRERMVQAFNGTLSDEDKADILEEVKELTETMVELFNTDYAGRYVFGGYNTETKPATLGTAGGLSTILYQGAALQDADSTQDRVIRTGVGSTVTANIQGCEVMGESPDGIYDVLMKFQVYLGGGATYSWYDTASGTVQTETLETGTLLEELDGNADNVLGLTAKVGARLSELEMRIQRIASDSSIYTTLLSETQDVDIAKISVEYSEASSVYEASLASASKLVLPTLVDFLL